NCGAARDRIEVTKLEKKPLADALFVAPPGYQTIDLEQMMNGLMAGHMPPGMMPGQAPGMPGQPAPSAPGQMPTTMPPNMQQMPQGMPQMPPGAVGGLSPAQRAQM